MWTGLGGRNRALTAFADDFLNLRYSNEVIPAVEFGGPFISPGPRTLYSVEAGVKF